MLLNSPTVAAQLSPRVRAHHDPVDRWLELLREQPDLQPRLTGSGSEYGTPTTNGGLRELLGGGGLDATRRGRQPASADGTAGSARLCG